MSEWLEYLRQLNMASMILRILLAVFIGGTLGFEREKKRRPAGFRTYMLVALGASLTMILSQYLDIMLSTEWADIAAQVGVRTDVSRFGAQVINGVGFLGAGTIIITGKLEVTGLTTAAALWASACLGLAVGAGFYEGAIVCMLMVEICMKIFPRIEDYLNSHSRNMNVYLELDSYENLNAVIAGVKQLGCETFGIDLSNESHGSMRNVAAHISLGLPKMLTHSEVLSKLASSEGIMILEEVR